MGNGRYYYTHRERKEADERQLQRMRQSKQGGGQGLLHFFFRRLEYVFAGIVILVVAYAVLYPALTFVSKIFSGLSF